MIDATTIAHRLGLRATPLSWVRGVKSYCCWEFLRVEARFERLGSRPTEAS